MFHMRYQGDKHNSSKYDIKYLNKPNNSKNKFSETIYQILYFEDYLLEKYSLTHYITLYGKMPQRNIP